MKLACTHLRIVRTCACTDLPKIFVVVYNLHKSLKFCKDPSFHCGDFCKTIVKSYLTVTLGLYQSYISHYIPPIYHPYIIKMKAIFQKFEFGENLKTHTFLTSKKSKMVNTMNIVFCFGPRLGLKIKVYA